MPMIFGVRDTAWREMMKGWDAPALCQRCGAKPTRGAGYLYCSDACCMVAPPLVREAVVRPWWRRWFF
jgi:hypothetical protein